LLTSESSGAKEVIELLRKAPDKWLGAILRHPSLDAATAGLLPINTPPLFIVAGSLERSVPGLQKFVESAQAKGISARLYIQKDCGHEIFSTDELRNTLIEELKFYQSVNKR
jgi:predicted esterase